MPYQLDLALITLLPTFHEGLCMCLSCGQVESSVKKPNDFCSEEMFWVKMESVCACGPRQQQCF